jgi:tripeptide aminopeptidase
VSPTRSELPEAAQLLIELCEIPSPSRHEGDLAIRMRRELEDIGCTVTEDDAATAVGAGCGNIVGRLPATAPGTPIVLCAHLDTVPVVGPIEAEVDDGGVVTNRHAAILGGDDKAAIAAMITAVREVLRQGAPHAGIEFLLTPCEEIGLLGAHHFDPARLEGEVAFIYDHAGPVGNIITSAPWHKRVTARVVGTAAHAGMEPENGHSAISAAARAIASMPLGRIDAETTANVGTIHGGQATNVVAPGCEVVAEARSRSLDALGAQVSAMVDALTEAAIAGGCDLECRVDTQYVGYVLASDDLQVRMAEQALRAVGITPVHVPGGGGSDANALLRNGFPAVNLCNAMIDVHTANESIAIRDVTTMVAVTRALIDGAVGS